MHLEVESEERRVKNSIDSFKGKKADAVENSLRPSGYGLVFEFFYLFTFLLFYLYLKFAGSLRHSCSSSTSLSAM